MHIAAVCKSSRRTRAFTLIELLVVISIIGVLIGLLLPAVQSARETARRAQCTNNLKQIGLALANYEGVNSVFPHSSTSAIAGSGGTCQNGIFSWHALILPYLEQRAVYDSINFNIGMAGDCGDPLLYYHATISISHPNATAGGVMIQSFLCPTDTGATHTSSMGSSRPAPESYAGNVGWPPGTNGTTGFRGSGSPSKHNGFIALLAPGQSAHWHTGSIRIADITDGLGMTAAVAERRIAVASDPSDYPSILRQPQTLQSFCAGSAGSSRTLERWNTWCDSVSLCDPSWSVYHGRAWISGWGHTSGTYMHVMPMNGRNCHLYGGEATGEIIVTPSSLHSGGINVLFGDGSVRFAKQSMDRAVWWSLGSRDGGEVVSDASL